MKKLKCYLIGILLAGTLLSGCGKEKETNKGHYSPNQGENVVITTPENSPIVNINNIVAQAGEPIDYMASIQSVENIELEKSMIHIDSSGVDTFTPGIYTATYSFDYMGTIVNRMITVTIEPNPERETEAPTSVLMGSSTETESQTSTDSSGETNQGGDTQTESSSVDTPNQAVIATLDTLEEQDIPDADITLSNGTVVKIKCTASRYIVETFTDETYYEENGFTYLNSELKVVFNTGDTQVVETVINRVASSPQQE